MVSGIDRILIAVPDPVSAAWEYGRLVGCDPLPPATGSGAQDVRCFDLGNTVIELRAASAPAHIAGLVFRVEGGETEPVTLSNFLGLNLQLVDGTVTAGQRAGGPRALLRVDHLVLRTTSAQDCIELFSGLGIRLALDKTVPEWGGRMLFFRTGKLTLEVVEPERGELVRDEFWGIAYECEDIEQSARRLRAVGVGLSDIRPGRKPGTRVATLKSHCLGIPSLLLQGVT